MIGSPKSTTSPDSDTGSVLHGVAHIADWALGIDVRRR